MTTVLISGAGIAGTALAYWLRRRGLIPTVVERAPGPRPGGQAVDVRGAALTVLGRMGLDDAARERRTTMLGMSMLDSNGDELWRSEEATLSSGRLDSDDIELLREDLVELIRSRTDGVEHRFDDSILAVDQDDEGATVRFERGAPQRFDLVVGADGLHSNTRRLVFGPETPFIRHLGTYVSIFSAENFLELDNWQYWFNDGGNGGAVYPVRENTELRINLGFAAEPFDYDHRDTEAQKRVVADRLGGMGWEVPRMIEKMWHADDFYFDSMSQICMDRWSLGRVALIGDAAHCASPLSGQGTSLALVGAYVLAEELAGRPGGHRAAFERYEERMRPFVECNQALATGDRDADPGGEPAVDRVKNAIELDGDFRRG